MKEFSVYIKNVKMSPKKLRFLLSGVRKQSPVEAVHTLMYTSSKGAVILRKAISSALANAKNTMNVDEGLLQFKSIFIEEGLKLKRFRAGGRGMAKPFKHKYSHVRVILTSPDSAVSKIVEPEEVGRSDGDSLELKAKRVKIQSKNQKDITNLKRKQ